MQKVLSVDIYSMYADTKFVGNFFTKKTALDKEQYLNFPLGKNDWWLKEGLRRKYLSVSQIQNGAI